MNLKFVSVHLLDCKSKNWKKNGWIWISILIFQLKQFNAAAEKNDYSKKANAFKMFYHLET